MSIKFNPFTGTLDFVGGSTTTTWKPPVADSASLPLSGNTDGDARVTRDTDEVWVWDNAGSRWENQQIKAGSTVGSTPNSVGYSIEVNETVANLRTNELALQPADGSNPGIVSTNAQNFSGNKTFDNDVIIAGNLTVNGTTTSINTTNLEVTDQNIVINNNGNDVSAEGGGITIERTGVDGSFVYEDALASKFKAGSVGSEIELANVSSAQTITNKTIDADNNTISNLAHGAEVDDPSSGVHGVTGNVVGDTDVQTLTNKTIDGNNNTISNLAHGAEVDNPSSGVHGVTGNVVGDSDAQTLTNKTIDGDDNTIQDVALSSLKTELADADKFIQRDATGVVVSGKDVPTGDVVGNSDTQTLTNKVIDADNNTISNLTHGAEVDDPASGVHGVTGNIVGDSDTQTLTNKTIDADLNSVSNIDDADIKAGAAIDATKIGNGDVDNTELSSLNNISGNVQGQLDALNTSLSDKVTGPASATDEAIARYDAATGKLIQDSVALLSDAGALSGLTKLDVDDIALDGTTISTTLVDSDLVLSPNGTGDIDANTNVIKNVVDPSNAQDAATKNYVDSSLPTSPGDLNEVSFSLANNQSVLTDVTGVSFNNGVVRSAELEFSVVIDATADLYESGTILAVQRGADWSVSINSNGDNSQVLFDINASGQLQYTSANYAGFVSGTVKVRARTTSV